LLLYIKTGVIGHQSYVTRAAFYYCVWVLFDFLPVKVDYVWGRFTSVLIRWLI